ncbi:hypothetical protein [Miniphocaeibacter halophilus]|uniref:Uncharacterized protein n=1 Tax=Miniphocaeibacter halophilus TaxID=2931922 RepID=A0AC61MSR1_9FIRM|nr:hypothetical protein [Miniphocaeibacter halophilus]QQK07353.1 hypothetical protein JFY71_08505 [Miniphocaeibacter halophilus]
MENKLMDLSTNRMNNITWTVANNYNFIPNYNIFKFEDNNKINIYKSALAGFSYGKFQIEEVYNFLYVLTEDNPYPDDYYKITELMLEEYFWFYYDKYRPGIVEFRDYTTKEKYNNYKFRTPNNLAEELEYAYYSRKLSYVPKTREMVILLLNDIMNIKNIKNTSDLILKIDKIIKRHFHIHLNINYEQNLKKSLESSKEKDKLPKDLKVKIEFKNRNQNVLDKDQVEAAEFNKSSFLFEDREIDRDLEENNLTTENYTKEGYLKDLAEKVYGKSILSSSNTSKLENKLCTGIHEGIQILLTRGKFGKSLNEQFRESEKQEIKKENLEHFNKNYLIYKRSITKLREVIRREILTDLNESKYLSTNGKLIPSLLWKPKYINNNKIFLKEKKDEIGTVSVDILLDSSASQIERQALIASQGFIIAQSLTDLNIPTRVMSFNNFYNVLILKIFRDYFDSDNKNQNIFEYTASGSNRDGLAIKTVSYLMNNTGFERRILIVLSDGKPNDKINLKIIGNINKKAKDYIKEDAIKDSSKEVFLSRNSDNIVLGVFTGEEEDLPSEKKIYGNDFAYISNINRFSDIVGSFLKNVLINELE